MANQYLDDWEQTRAAILGSTGVDDMEPVTEDTVKKILLKRALEAKTGGAPVEAPPAPPAPEAPPPPAAPEPGPQFERLSAFTPDEPAAPQSAIAPDPETPPEVKRAPLVSRMPDRKLNDAQDDPNYGLSEPPIGDMPEHQDSPIPVSPREDAPEPRNLDRFSDALMYAGYRKPLPPDANKDPLLALKKQLYEARINKTSGVTPPKPVDEEMRAADLRVKNARAGLAEVGTTQAPAKLKLGQDTLALHQAQKEEKDRDDVRDYDMATQKFAFQKGAKATSMINQMAKVADSNSGVATGLRAAYAISPDGTEEGGAKRMNDLANAIGLGGTPESLGLTSHEDAALRQAYKMAALEWQHKLFGASLTSGEKSEAEQFLGNKATYTPQAAARAMQLMKSDLYRKLAGTQSALKRNFPEDYEDWALNSNGMSFDDPFFDDVRNSMPAAPQMRTQAPVHEPSSGGVEAGIQGGVNQLQKQVGPKAAAALNSNVPTTVRVPPPPKPNKDAAAKAWALAHPNDPKSAAILEKLKRLGVQ